MEVLKDRVAEFLSVRAGDGSGDGSGSGSCYGDGYGSGYGSGDGSGDGSGSGYGYGDGSGDGYGSGSGYGYGDGSGDGYGSGSGYGSGIKTFCGASVHIIDNVQTIIYRSKGNVAKGAILNGDLTLASCYVVRIDDTFAHGKTLKEALAACREKLFEDMPQDERIAAFVKGHKLGVEYPVRDLYDWHHRLTGSCKMGRDAFARDHGIDVEHDKMTVERFVELTKDAYGGDVIRAVAKAYQIETK